MAGVIEKVKVTNLPVAQPHQILRPSWLNFIEEAQEAEDITVLHLISPELDYGSKKFDGVTGNKLKYLTTTPPVVKRDNDKFNTYSYYQMDEEDANAAGTASAGMRVQDSQFPADKSFSILLIIEIPTWLASLNPSASQFILWSTSTKADGAGSNVSATMQVTITGGGDDLLFQFASFIAGTPITTGTSNTATTTDVGTTAGLHYFVLTYNNTTHTLTIKHLAEGDDPATQIATYSSTSGGGGTYEPEWLGSNNWHICSNAAGSTGFRGNLLGMAILSGDVLSVTDFVNDFFVAAQTDYE